MYSLLVVNTHKKDKKPDSPSSHHRTGQQSSIPSSIPHPNKDHYLQVMTTLSC